MSFGKGDDKRKMAPNNGAISRSKLDAYAALEMRGTNALTRSRISN